MNIHDDWATPFERGNGNQTTTWRDCIDFHQRLARAFPSWLRFDEAGRSDGGVPIHVGVFSNDGVFDPPAVKAAGRSVFFNNNGIHPGEPEGVDACMALLRDLCLDPARRAALGRTVLVFIPVYNVDGALNRHDTSRVNQNGPEAFGFRGNARHLDLNRDFIKADSLNTRSFAQVFTRWDPDVMVDTHTSNGADYQHVVTLIATQPDKLGGRTGEHLRETMLPALYADMAERGFPMCPYVNPLQEIPDDGIADFLDSPRFSTGYAALHHTIGFMPETHMLKAFEARYHGTRALVEAALAHTVAHGDAIRAARAADRAAIAGGAPVALDWSLDRQRSRPFRFSGFTAVHEPSRLGSYQRLRYDRGAPWVKDIPYFDRYRTTVSAVPPRAYLLPQAWHDVALRLQGHGVPLQRALRAGRVPAEACRITRFDKRRMPFEGRHLHDVLEVETVMRTADVAEGDWLVPLGGPHDRFIVEVLEPLGIDSFFRWAFFDSVLDKKESFSDYVFEDEAERLLDAEPGLRARFEAWKAEHPDLLGDREAVLGFIFLAAQRYAEPEWRLYPVLRLLELPATLFSAED
ncbi:M14 family zinc carboxypeptidase [Rhizobacter sp. OV335]|uniref:M14 family zinc carboxypeptidase n=1 Tax=Rhizobacter sp. OV335 TaxID=1500264 RepID=UPI000911F516|nr:M14 family zinc carboxypeptidase [Rhizobacter sp. OV335]SHN38586.1 Zinc carboxypeptidase [Rhizobacter sp. OV335]